MTKYTHRHCIDCGGPLGWFRNKPSRCRACYLKQSQSRRSAHRRANEITHSIKACEVCGSSQNLERHHLDNNPFNNSPDNVQVLCRRCHMEIDGRLGWAAKPKIRKTCLHCDGSFEVRPSSAHQTFCCRPCYLAFRKERRVRQALGFRYSSLQRQPAPSSP